MTAERVDLVPDAPTAARELARVSDHWQQVLLDQSVAKVFVDAGMFKDLKSVAQAMVKIWAGRELGIGDYAAVSMIHMVEGKPEPAGTLVAALVQRHPDYDYTVTVNTDERCEIEFFARRDGEWVPKGVSVFTMEMAKQAGLAGKQNWKQYPAAMLFNRAMTQGARSRVPAVYGGVSVYAEGEISGDEPAPDMERVQAAIEATATMTDVTSVGAGAVTEPTTDEPEVGEEAGDADSPTEGSDEPAGGGPQGTTGASAEVIQPPSADSPEPYPVMEMDRVGNWQEVAEATEPKMSAAQRAAIFGISKNLGWSKDDLHLFANVDSLTTLTKAAANKLIDALKQAEDDATVVDG